MTYYFTKAGDPSVGDFSQQIVVSDDEVYGRDLHDMDHVTYRGQWLAQSLSKVYEDSVECHTILTPDGDLFWQKDDF